MTRPLPRASCAGLLAAAALLVSACADKTTPAPPVAADPCIGPGAEDDPRCEAPIAPYTGDHAIDAATHALFARAGHVPEPAGATELCRRLGGDLLGRFPSADEAAALCGGGQSAGAIARAMQ